MTKRGALCVPTAALCIAACWGCGSALSTSNGGQNAAVGPVSVVEPSSVGEKTLCLVNDNEKLMVGDLATHWQQVFPRPMQGTFAIKELPKALSTGALRAVGWETANKGFGVVINNDKTALAMAWEGKDPASRASEINDLYTKLNRSIPAEKVASHGMTYVFWQGKGVRMMLFTQRKGEDSYNVTVCLGEDQLMDALRASPIQAQDDLQLLYPKDGTPPIIGSTPSLPTLPVQGSSTRQSSNSKQVKTTSNSAPGMQTNSATPPSGSQVPPGTGTAGESGPAATNGGTTGNDTGASNQGQTVKSGTNGNPSDNSGRQ